jgi:hypothetical protein
MALWDSKDQQALTAVLTRAERAIEDPDVAGLQLALAELRELSDHAPEKLHATHQARDLVRALEVELAARQTQALVSRLGLGPCACGSVELLVSGETQLETLIIDGESVDLRLRIVACPRCGDIRLKAQDPEVLLNLRTGADRLAFTRVNVGTERGPFR